MKKNISQLLASAMVLGLVAGSTAAVAGSNHPKKDDANKSAKKNGCGGKAGKKDAKGNAQAGKKADKANACGGKDGCGSKDGCGAADESAK